MTERRDPMYQNNSCYYSMSNPMQFQSRVPSYDMQAPKLKGYPVSSLDKVRAAQIDFDGSLFVFPDIANRKIYSKQINLDGTAVLNEYDLAEKVAPAATVGEFVTKQEFEETVSSIKELLSGKPQDISETIYYHKVVEAVEESTVEEVKTAVAQHTIPHNSVVPTV